MPQDMDSTHNQIESTDGVECIQETQSSTSKVGLDTIGVGEQTDNALGRKPRRAVKGKEKVNGNVISAITQRQAEKPTQKQLKKLNMGAKTQPICPSRT